MKKRNAVCAVLMAAAVAVSAMSIGFASWRTEVKANGGMSTSGNWSVAITDASMKYSTGAGVAVENATMERSNVKDDTLIASVISASTWVDDANQIGTQSEETMSAYTYYYAVDTTKFALDDVLSGENFATISADESTYVVSDHINMYYRYLNGDPTVGTSEGSKASAQKVVDGLLRDVTADLKATYPDTYENYVLVYMSKYAGRSYEIAQMAQQSVDEDDLVSFTDTDVTFADVNFAVPNAWASYTITVTNNGTVNANLANAEIRLDTEDTDQLVLEAPDLSDEVLAPGESCTLTAVVKALDNGSGTLDAAGKLVISLPYAQDSVEAAPEAGHTHG